MHTQCMYAQPNIHQQVMSCVSVCAPLFLSISFWYCYGFKWNPHNLSRNKQKKKSQINVDKKWTFFWKKRTKLEEQKKWASAKSTRSHCKPLFKWFVFIMLGHGITVNIVLPNKSVYLAYVIHVVVGPFTIRVRTDVAVVIADALAVMSLRTAKIAS